ncbi:hypothetical protein [Iningainema tapete]|uniref:Uncharacterized protein n=1 Tax=Iningainema tapete BLCC-T55 TaxID=2748662 RepID=A0A8J7BY91_9CYAN|nr:hypothetical protein [Iningainema tapete]MBD2775292.1 hypothetical protein [Iningainema tapete BLCC-T55]
MQSEFSMLRFGEAIAHLKYLYLVYGTSRAAFFIITYNQKYLQAAEKFGILRINIKSALI